MQAPVPAVPTPSVEEWREWLIEANPPGASNLHATTQVTLTAPVLSSQTPITYPPLSVYSAPAPIPTAIRPPAPVPVPMPVAPPNPIPVVTSGQASAAIEDSDSSDDSADQGRQLYNPEFPTPSIAYLNPVAMSSQAPNVSHVSAKLQRKIQCGDYVDLGKLYRPDTPNNQEQIVSIKPNGMLKISSQPKSSDIYRFGRFLDCFIVYMSIRGKSHPNELLSMLKYVETIKGLFNQGFDGIYYDKRFRMMRADNPIIPWSCYMAELLIRKAPAKDTNNKPGFNANTSSPQNNQKRYCYYFNSGKCSRGAACKYIHACSICSDKSHGKKTCGKK